MRQFGQGRSPEPEHFRGGGRVEPARSVVLSCCVGQPGSPDDGCDHHGGQDPDAARSPAQGAVGSSGPLPEPNLGRSRTSGNANAQPGQVVVRFAD